MFVLIIVNSVLILGCMVSDSEAQWSLRSNFGRQSVSARSQTDINKIFATLPSKIVDKYWWSFSGRSKINECKVLAQDRYTRNNIWLGGKCFVNLNWQAMCRAESYQLEVPDYRNDCLPFINHVVASYEKDQNRRSNAPKPTPKASRPLPTTRRSFGSILTTRRPFRPIPTTRRPPVAARECSFFGVRPGKCTGVGQCSYNGNKFPAMDGQCPDGSPKECDPPVEELIKGRCGRKYGRNVCIATTDYRLYGDSLQC